MKILSILSIIALSIVTCNAQVGSKIDLTQYHLTFHDEFNVSPYDGSGLSINEPLGSVLSPGGGWGPMNAPARWIEHTPWSGDFGLAYFTGPAETCGDKDVNGACIQPPSAFSFTPYKPGLNIRAYHDQNICHWRSGIIAGVDTHGAGFSQSLGYWEAAIWIPGPMGQVNGIWPAFTLQDQKPLPFGKPRTIAACEIDVMEMYGVDLTKLHQRAHVWQPNGQDTYGSTIAPAPGGATITIADPTTGFHRFGCLIDNTTIHYLYDGVITFEAPIDQTFTDPLFATVDFALGGGWPINLAGAETMKVLYVRAYQHN